MMKFLIITHAIHKTTASGVYSYAPYVREMNLWLKHVGKVEVIAPVIIKPVTNIDLPYIHENLEVSSIPAIQFTSIINSFKSILKLPIITYKIFKACKKANHIHLRCPGNIGLLGCFVQMLFPKKIKTAKYAGNWDPLAKQPKSYKLQKWLLSNVFLTKNMKVLVYGNWSNQSHNIKPFFTASFSKNEKEIPYERDYTSNLKFIFIGSLVYGKRPLESIKIIEGLRNRGISANLDMFGNGILLEELKQYIVVNNLDKIVTLHGNQSKELVKQYLKQAHFVILPSLSEGWPKAVAEGMFFGAIPIATNISCVPTMLNNGERGILLDVNLNGALEKIMTELKEPKQLAFKSKQAALWSQQYTLEYFESEIINLIKAK